MAESSEEVYSQFFQSESSFFGRINNLKNPNKKITATAIEVELGLIPVQPQAAAPGFSEPPSQPSENENELKLLNIQDYGNFLAPNYTYLQARFDSLHKYIRNGKITLEDEDYIYLYYRLILQLEQFFHGRKKFRIKNETYKKLRLELSAYLNEANISNANQKAKTLKDEYFILFALNELKEAALRLLKTPTSTEDSKGWIGYLNVMRLLYTFSRLSLVTGFQWLEAIHFIDKIQKTFGVHLNITHAIQLLQLPVNVLRVLSVAFFASRFILELGLAVKHAFFTKEGEYQYTFADRLRLFFAELYGRRVNLVNDLVWTLVNLLCNYNYLFHISAGLAGWLTFGFLLFDAAWIVINWFLEQPKNQAKLDIIQKRIEELQIELNNASEAEKPKIRRKIDIENMLKREQQKQIEADFARTLFNVGAASFIAAGFATALIFTPAGIGTIAFFLCVIGVGMYLSAGAFREMRMKQLECADAQKAYDSNKSFENKSTWAAAQEEYSAAKQELCWTMLKNTVVPMLIMASISVCWEVAVVLAVVYIVSEVYEAYQKYKQNKLEFTKAPGMFFPRPNPASSIVQQQPEEDPVPHIGANTYFPASPSHNQGAGGM